MSDKTFSLGDHEFRARPFTFAELPTVAPLFDDVNLRRWDATLFTVARAIIAANVAGQPGADALDGLAVTPREVVDALRLIGTVSGFLVPVPKEDAPAPDPSTGSTSMPAPVSTSDGTGVLSVS